MGIRRFLSVAVLVVIVIVVVTMIEVVVVTKTTTMMTTPELEMVKLAKVHILVHIAGKRAHGDSEARDGLKYEVLIIVSNGGMTRKSLWGRD